MLTGLRVASSLHELQVIHDEEIKPFLCLEPAGFLNAVNTPSFEPVWLRPGETYRQSMTFRLTTDR